MSTVPSHTKENEGAEQRAGVFLLQAEEGKGHEHPNGTNEECNVCG